MGYDVDKQIYVYIYHQKSGGHHQRRGLAPQFHSAELLRPEMAGMKYEAVSNGRDN